MSGLPGYGKVWHVGHRAVKEIFDAPVYIQEKVDGSQFSFGNLGDGVLMRSKSVEVFHADDNRMFAAAADYVSGLALPVGVIFRGEVLSKPKHNALTYGRVPRHNVILFDVQRMDASDEVDPIDDLARWGDSLDLEAVEFLDHRLIASSEMLSVYLDADSALGGTKVEGVVCKRYDAWDQYGSPLRAKFVSEAFKETHSKEWKGANPNTNDIIANIVAMYRTDARWEKSVQHLREAGMLDGSPRDIGPLLKAIHQDVIAECKEEIAEMCFRELWRKGIGRGITAGAAEWYKQKLLESQVVDNPEVIT